MLVRRLNRPFGQLAAVRRNLYRFSVFTIAETYFSKLFMSFRRLGIN
jgi:hypothetical protein